MADMTRCCGKTSYATQRVADATLRFLHFVAIGSHPVRAYRCPYGWWHLTSQPTPRPDRSHAR